MYFCDLWYVEVVVLHVPSRDGSAGNLWQNR